MKESQGGGREGAQGEVELPQGINTPGVAELPQGDENPGVATKGEGVPGEDGRGCVGDGNPPTTRETREAATSSRDKERTPRLQRGTASVGDSAGNLLRYTAGADSARPKHGALARREYGLLSPTELAVDPADAGNQVSGDVLKENRGTADQAQRETETEEGTRQCVLPSSGMQEDEK